MLLFIYFLAFLLSCSFFLLEDEATGRESEREGERAREQERARNREREREQESKRAREWAAKLLIACGVTTYLPWCIKK